MGKPARRGKPTHGKALAKRKVGKHGPDAATWAHLVRAFGARPDGSMNSVAKEVGVSWATARKAFEEGWPDEGLGPISKIIAEQTAAARALACAATGEAPIGGDVDRLVQAALPAALYQVAEESRMLESLRQLAVKLAQTVGRAMAACDEVSDAALGRLVSDVQLGIVSPVDAMRVVGTVAGMGKVATDMIGELMKMHRLALGQPGEIIGHQVFSSPEEALAIIDRGTRAAQRARELGLVALPGGRGDAGGVDEDLDGPAEG